MLFKKPLPPPAHLRSFVVAKESWGSVWKQLEFRPKTTHLSLRQQSIDAATQSAIDSSYLLLAVEHFDILVAKDRPLVVSAGEEPILLECLAFASSVVCNGVNPESDEYEMLLDSRQSLITSYNLMSLLDADDIEDVALFTYSTPRIPDDDMAEPLRQAGVEVHVIGDCYAPCSSMAATAQGHSTGNLL